MAENQTITTQNNQPEPIKIDLGMPKDEKIKDSGSSDNTESFILEISKLKQPMDAEPTYIPKNFFEQFAHYNDSLWCNINNTWRNISSGNKSLVRAYRSGDQTVSSGSYAKVAFNAENYDIGNNFDTSSNVFTAPRTGYYEVSCTLYTSQSTTGNLVMITANINSSGTYYSRALSYSRSASESYSFKDVIPLTVGNTLEIQYNQSSGSSQTINGGVDNSWIIIKEI